ncbi:MAG TPA: 50S ribosomal protein L23 [Rhabdochlamydiaceae bacterium]|jgi:large subunit ribosomal protein L23
MKQKNPYDIVLSRHMTEKAHVLQTLQSNTSNASVKKCNTPKYVFIVAKSANKPDIARAVEEIYKESKVRVVAVNTINVRQKGRRVRGRKGVKAGFKKAIVSLQPGDVIEEKG